jgi:hypothetical protein
MVDWSGSSKTDIPFMFARVQRDIWCRNSFMADIAWMTIKVHLGGRAPSMFHAMTIGMLLFHGAAMVARDGMEKRLG